MERTARMQSPLHRTDARSKLLVTVVFLVTMLSVPLCRLPELLLFFVFPIVACAMGGLSYGTIFRRSLVVLPFVVFIGVFNLFYDREPVSVSGRWRSPQGGSRSFRSYCADCCRCRRCSC